MSNLLRNLKCFESTTVKCRDLMIQRSISLTQSYNEVDNTNKPNDDMTNPYEKEKPKCILCQLNISPDYKNVKLLSQFQSSFTGRIYGKHITGLCTNKQKQVELEIQKAQSAGLMAYYNKDPDFMQDPNLFEPENPIRPHRF